MGPSTKNEVWHQPKKLGSKMSIDRHYGRSIDDSSLSPKNTEVDRSTMTRSIDRNSLLKNLTGVDRSTEARSIDWKSLPKIWASVDRSSWPSIDRQELFWPLVFQPSLLPTLSSRLDFGPSSRRSSRLPWLEPRLISTPISGPASTPPRTGPSADDRISWAYQVSIKCKPSLTCDHNNSSKINFRETI